MLGGHGHRNKLWSVGQIKRSGLDCTAPNQTPTSARTYPLHHFRPQSLVGPLSNIPGSVCTVGFHLRSLPVEQQHLVELRYRLQHVWPRFLQWPPTIHPRNYIF